MLVEYAIFSGEKYLGTFESVNPVYALAELDSKRLTMPCVVTFSTGKTVMLFDDGKEYTIYFK